MVTTRASNRRLAQRWPSVKRTTPGKKEATSRRIDDPKRAVAAKKAVATRRAKAERKAATITKAVATRKANATAKKIVAYGKEYGAQMVAIIREVDERVMCKEVRIVPQDLSSHCRGYFPIPDHLQRAYSVGHKDPPFHKMPEHNSKEALNQWRALEEYKVSRLSVTHRTEPTHASFTNLSFLNLAPEIRALIYRHAFADTKCIISGPLVKYQPLLGRWLHARPGEFVWHHNLYPHVWSIQLWQPCAIHLTCRLIYNETRQIAREVTSLDWHWSNCLGGFRLPRLPPWYAVKFGSIQKVELVHHLDTQTIMETWNGIKDIVFNSELLLTYRSALSGEVAREEVVRSHIFRHGDKFHHCKTVAQDLGERVSVSLKVPCTYASEDGQYVETWTLRLKLPSMQLLDYSLTHVRNRCPNMPDIV